jgi:uncharacterized membrane protein
LPDPVGQFEMRRLEMLSNTVFGVAMTLLAYDLPDASSFKSAPGWIELYRTYASHVIALVLSFIIAGMFWFSHQRRLVAAPLGSRGVVMLNLLFLMTIVVLPVTNGLYATWRDSSVIETVYGLHMALIAGINALLWRMALPAKGSFALLAPALVPVAVFCVATLLAQFHPGIAPWIWPLAFAAPLLAWLAQRRQA